MEDEVTVGDLDSNARGSGARKSAGKPELDLIPVSHWLDMWRPILKGEGHMDLIDVLESLAAWQTGDDIMVRDALFRMHLHWRASVQVFEYGKKKYAAWNWAKGMKWSVPLGCILRHIERIVAGEDIDQDSGGTHKGCITCNLHMLVWYLDHYREGDDRPIFDAPAKSPSGLRQMSIEEALRAGGQISKYTPGHF